MAIEQEHLLFGADSRDAALDTIVLEHPRERGKIFQQRLHERLRLLLIDILLDVMFSHGLLSCEVVVGQDGRMYRIYKMRGPQGTRYQHRTRCLP